MLDRVRHYIDMHHMIASGETVLVGVSGGLDSMVLLHILRVLQIDVEVAHVNYHMRGEESDGDEHMVRQYCAEKRIPFYVLNVDTEEERTGESFQEKARRIRYSFFEEQATSRQILRIAVAHHLDDQAETVLLKLFTGTGIEGLSGMAPVRAIGHESDITLIRPLLECRRTEIASFAEEHQVPWREDNTNAESTYRRNALRNRIMPLIEEHFGSIAPSHIAQAATILKGYWEHSLRPALFSRLEACIAFESNIRIRTLEKEPRVWQKRIVLEMLYRWLPGKKVSVHDVDAVLDLLNAQVGRKTNFSGGSVWRERDYLVFKPEEENAVSNYLVHMNEDVHFSEGVLEVRMESPETDPPIIMNRNVIVADSQRLSFPLVLRTWQSGDRMVPFGMQGRKKVSDILTDVKMPSNRRDRIYVLESAGEIVWVVGVRMSDTVKLDGDTEEVVRITFIPESKPSSQT